MAKKALGNGIDALFGTIDKSEKQQDSGGISVLPIDVIKPAPDQPRKTFNEEAMAELADSIRQQGIIQPILVQEINNTYRIVAGERRFRASKLAGLTEVPVIIKKFSEEERLEIAIIENIQREDLTALEEAEAYKQMIDQFSLSQDEVAQKVGKKRSTVANSLRLLKLPEDIKTALQSNEISAGHCRAILSVINPADQRILFNRISTNSLSVRESEQQAAELNKGSRLSEKPATQPAAKSVDFEVSQIEQQFINILGTKVSIKGSLKKGKIEIAYFSKDDLERVYDIINK